MSGVVIEVHSVGLDDALSRLEELANVQTYPLMERVARLVQERTRKRISEDKQSPDGTPWKPNASRTSTLLRSGQLYNSIDYLATSDTAIVGSGLVYARIHQLGGTIKPNTAKALAFMAGGHLVYASSVNIPPARISAYPPTTSRKSRISQSCFSQSSWTNSPEGRSKCTTRRLAPWRFPTTTMSR
mgnify:CR=1 FL=1